jgi:hypothetical protein
MKAEEPMTLVERLRNPQWTGGDGRFGVFLDPGQTRIAMDDAADEIERLRNQVASLEPFRNMAEQSRMQQQAILSEAIQAAVAKERARCASILQAGRTGEIDTDLRSLISRIEKPR